MVNLSGKDMDKFIQDRHWSVKDGRIKFSASKESLPGSRKIVTADDELVPTKELAQMVLTYAKEMEKIV